VIDAHFLLPPVICGGMGAVMALLAVYLLLCGHRQTCYLTVYSFFTVLIVLAQGTVATLFLMTSTRNKLLDALNLSSVERDFIASNITIIGYCFIGIAGMEAFSVVLACFHRNAIIDDRETDYEANESGSTSLLGNGRSKSRVEMGTSKVRGRERGSGTGGGNGGAWLGP
jgi:hypothetical protein